MRTEEGLFHPECHKDKDNGMDASNVDTSMEEASSPVKKELIEEEKQEVADNDVPMEDIEVDDKEEVAVKVEQKEDTNGNDSKENVKEEKNVTTDAINTALTAKGAVEKKDQLKEKNLRRS